MSSNGLAVASDAYLLTTLILDSKNVLVALVIRETWRSLDKIILNMNVKIEETLPQHQPYESKMSSNCLAPEILAACIKQQSL
jgi:glutamate mutase epsilon subunit